MPEGNALTRHHAIPQRFFGYPLKDLGKIYGLFAGLMFALVLSYTKHLELFNDIGSKEFGFRLFVTLFAAFGLAVVLPAIGGFFWWASGALVNYSKWMVTQPNEWCQFCTLVSYPNCWISNIINTWLHAVVEWITGVSRIGLNIWGNYNSWISRLTVRLPKMLRIALYVPTIIFRYFLLAVAFVWLFLITLIRIPFEIHKWLTGIVPKTEDYVPPHMWRWFWMVIFLFYSYVELDPLDSIHPSMASNGLAPAPNLLLLFDGKLELFQFQWGYFLLWFLFWFLVAALHWQYVVDAMRDVWFFSSRVNRYGTSVLTGFRETARTQSRPAETLRDLADAQWPGRKLRRIPQLCQPITGQQAKQIIDADLSGAIASAPGQPTVLFIDLGAYAFSPGLEALVDDAGKPLLAFRECEISPSASRESLVEPLYVAPPADYTEPGIQLGASGGEV